MTLNVCQAGHETHESKLVETLYGPRWIWDWEKYQGQALYCTGQDEVSKSIDLQQVWERRDTEHFWQVLGEQAGAVLDFGSHIGWFSMLAYRRGCNVECFDADPENLRLMWENFHLFGDDGVSGGSLASTLGWVVDAAPATMITDHVRLMKVDIEGHEHEALNLTRHLWQQRKIDYGLWELSPIFEKRDGIMADSYAALVDEIASYGYRWFIWKGDERWYFTVDEMTWPQENAWCEKL